MPNMIAIGDSVSIGYTPQVAALLNGSVQVQHSPWGGGGGADDVANGGCDPHLNVLLSRCDRVVVSLPLGDSGAGGMCLGVFPILGGHGVCVCGGAGDIEARPQG